MDDLHYGEAFAAAVVFACESNAVERAVFIT
jgi:hypothetical protein